MNIISVLIWIFIIIIVIVIILIATGAFRKPPPPDINIEELLQEGKEKANWTPANPVPNSDRAACLVYTFPAGSNPTTEQSVVDKLQGISVNQNGCLLSNQLALEFVERTCGVEGNNSQTCIGNDGTVYKRGQTEKFYQQCQAENCKSAILANIAMNFRTGSEFDQSLCIEATLIPDIPLLATQCKQQINQLYKVTRTNSKDLTPSPDGAYAKIQYQVSGQCLVPEEDNSSVLVLGDCKPNDGFVWFLAPPVAVTQNNTTTITPQQLIYTKQIIEPVPSSSNFVQYVQNNNLKSIQPFEKFPGIFVPLLQDVAFDSQTDPFANTQILDYRLYDLYVWTNPQIEPPANSPDINFPFYVWT